MILVDPEDRPPLDVDPPAAAEACAQAGPDRLFIAPQLLILDLPH